MASKKKQKDTSTSTRITPGKFVDPAAIKRYDEKIFEKTIIPERGICAIDNGNTFPGIADKWGLFLELRQNAVVPWVREFYSNVDFKKKKLEIKVRGKKVQYDRSSINRLYGLQDIEDDEYQQSLANPDLDEVMRTLCTENAQWTMKNGRRKNFKTSFLKSTLKPWYLFICASLIPTSNGGEVTIPRAMLLYALCTNRSIDVGLVLQQSIQHSLALTTTGGLVLPNTITELCKVAGLVVAFEDELLPPKHFITGAINRRIIAHAARVNDIPPPPAQPSQPSDTRDWEATLAQLRGDQMRYFQYRESFDAALAQRLDHPDQPHMPFPPFPHFNYADPATARDGDDNADDEN